VQRIAPSIFAVPTAIPQPGEYVATGAARQAAWILSGAEQPPAWPTNRTAVSDFNGDGSRAVRERYGELTELTATRPR
jgi:xylulokinase